MLRKVVIPLVTFPSVECLDFVLAGLKDCSVVAFNTKCYVRSPKEWPILRKAIRQTICALSELKAIVVYDACKDSSFVESIFEDALLRNIRVIVPDSMLKIRNRGKAMKRK